MEILFNVLKIDLIQDLGNFMHCQGKVKFCEIVTKNVKKLITQVQEKNTQKLELGLLLMCTKIDKNRSQRPCCFLRKGF